MGAELLLEARGVAKSYCLDNGLVPVLSALDLAIRVGDELLIVGASGSGKTTLLNMLSGLEQPSSGTIMFRGEEYGAMSDRARSALRAKNIGFVFQMHHLLIEFTALENVMLPAMLLGRTRGAVREEARLMLDKVGMGDRLEHYPSQLSGGESQRVAVARALINRPAMVFADEPTGNLDWDIGHKVIELLRELVSDNGGTLLLVSHDKRLQDMLPSRRLAGGVLGRVENGE